MGSAIKKHLIKYCKQPDHTTCGPVALYNLLKDKKLATCLNKSLQELKKLTKHQARVGVAVGDLEKALRKLSKKHNFSLRRLVPSFSTLKATLNKGHKIVATYRFKKEDDGGHVVYLTKATAKGLVTINDVHCDSEKGIVKVTRIKGPKTWETRIARGGFWAWEIYD